MVIDEKGAYSLTKYTNKKGDKTLVKESDHRTMILIFNGMLKLKAKMNALKYLIIKIFLNFETFKVLTENNKELTNCFNDEEENLDVSSNRWLKILNKIIKQHSEKFELKRIKYLLSLNFYFRKKKH